MRLALAALMVVASLAAAHAFGMGKLGFQFGRAGFEAGGKQTSGPAGSCSGTGLIFNVACNSQYIGIL